MLKKTKKKFVFTVTPPNELGFTFVTLLFTLIIFCLSIPFTAYLIKATQYDDYQDEISVMQFFQFLQDEFTEATDYAVTSDKIELTSRQKDKILIEQNGNLIRRSKRHGNEIYLRDVQKVSFHKHAYGIKAIIETKKGLTYEKKIFVYP